MVAATAPETKRVTILSVDPGAGYALARDTLGGEFMVNIQVRAKGTALPAEGELWIVNRQPGGSWFIGSQVGADLPPSLAGEIIPTVTDPLLTGLISALSGFGLVVDDTVVGDPPVDPPPPEVSGNVPDKNVALTNILAALDTAGLISNITTPITSSTSTLSKDGIYGNYGSGGRDYPSAPRVSREPINGNLWQVWLEGIVINSVVITILTGQEYQLTVSPIPAQYRPADTRVFSGMSNKGACQLIVESGGHIFYQMNTAVSAAPIGSWLLFLDGASWVTTSST